MKTTLSSSPARHSMRIAVAAGGLALLAACATTEIDPALLQARATVERSATDPQVTRYAAAEMDRAREALARTEAAARDSLGHEEIAHRAYLTEQASATATTLADARSAEQRIKDLTAERERALLAARTQEAQVAQMQAQIERQRATSAREQAQSAMAEAEAARQQAGQLQRELQEFSAKQTSRGAVVTLGGDVLFDSGQAQLRAGALRSLQRLAQVLQQHPDSRITVEGYTDSQGSDAFNLELSRRRAQAVSDALVAAGLPAAAIEIRAHGKAYPVAGNDTAAGRQMNRRVEIVVADGATPKPR